MLRDIRHFLLFSVALSLTALGVAVPSLAQTAAQAQTNEGLNAATQALSDVRDHMNLSKERITKLTEEVDNLKKDQKTLTTALVTAAKSERVAADNIVFIEQRLGALAVQEDEMRQKLNARRAEFAEVLAALERMGLKPPPALLVNPDDALASVRSAVLLGAVVPEMRTRTMELTTALRDLRNVRDAISAERVALADQQLQQAEEKKRLSLLLEEKAKIQQSSENALAEQRELTRTLTSKAKSLEDLMGELNRQSAALKTPSQRSNDKSLELSTTVDFDFLRGKLMRPVSGPVLRRFGVSGAQGESIEAQPAAIVVAPADAKVAYADNFRSYGQMVILDVGKDYRILIAGMERLNVAQGQFVLAGEPIGTMGAQLIASATALDIGKSTPMLYIEFRKGKDGKPIDPAPWWMTRALGRNANDS